jgi:electron transfer flavoprotein beta subunit
MKIVVCFKILADYARLSESDWNWDERHFVDTSFVRNIFNCFDESALEMALKLTHPEKNFSDPAELTALTVDDQKSDLFLKHLMATGFDHAVRIQYRNDIDLRFNPGAISCLLAAYVLKQGHQLVFSGIQGGDGDNWQTGPMIAEHLGWPCIREVARVERTKTPDCLKVTSNIDNDLLVQTVKLPLVLTVGQSQESPFLRYPTLKQKLHAGKKQVTLVTTHELGIEEDRLINNDKTLVSLTRPAEEQSCIFVNGRTPGEMARQLYDQFLKDRIPL